MDFASARRTMADNQIRTYDVTSIPLLAAFETVPRECFVQPDQHPVAYTDAPLMVNVPGAARTLLPPLVVARMLQAADIKADDKVLVVGGATGYGAALVATFTAEPVTLLEDSEAMADLAKASLSAAGSDHVNVITGALAHGHSAGGPYTLIVVEGAAEAEPSSLFAQLAEGGRLICVVGFGRAGRVTLFTKRAGVVGGRIIFDAAAPMLADFRQPAGFVF